MAGFSNYQRNRVLDTIFGGLVYSNDSTLYIALCKSAVSPDDDGNSIDEADYTGYSRVAVACNQTNWPAASNGYISNGTKITFPQNTGTSCTVTHFAILDNNSGGNLIAYGSLDMPKVINPGDDAPEFGEGSLAIQLT